MDWKITTEHETLLRQTLRPPHGSVELNLS